MKVVNTFIRVVLVLLGMQVSGQTYVLDNTFGDNGKKYFPGNTFDPNSGILFGNHYYFASNKQIMKLDYSGGIAQGFGTNGVLTLNVAPNFYISKIVAYNNQIIVSGQVYNNSNQANDFFVCKIDENGNLDTAFGNNGLTIVNFGAEEFVPDFVIEPSGKLYCVGQRYVIGSATQYSMIYFKINPNGTLDHSFDGSGYKSLTVNLMSGGNYITEYEDGFLLVGTSKVSGGDLESKLLLAKVDTNGALMTDFGTGGIRVVTVDTLFGINNSKSHFFYNNKLYLNDLFVFGFGSGTGSMLIYDVSSNHVDYHDNEYSTTDFGVYNDGVFLTGHWSSCGNSTSVYDCHNKFNLRKKHFDGTTDVNFQNNSVYQYEFPGNLDTNNKCEFLIRDNDGRFLIGAYSYMYSDASVQTQGFAMIRLTEGVLGTVGQASANAVTVFPNPFDGTVTISIAASIEKIELFDNAGRQLKSPDWQQSATGVLVDLSYLAAGNTYLAKIYTGDNAALVKKLVRK